MWLLEHLKYICDSCYVSHGQVGVDILGSFPFFVWLVNLLRVRWKKCFMEGSRWLQTPLPLAAPQSFARMFLRELAQSGKGQFTTVSVFVNSCLWQNICSERRRTRSWPALSATSMRTRSPRLWDPSCSAVCHPLMDARHAANSWGGSLNFWHCVQD